MCAHVRVCAYVCVRAHACVCVVCGEGVLYTIVAWSIVSVNAVMAVSVWCTHLVVIPQE